MYLGRNDAWIDVGGHVCPYYKKTMRLVPVVWGHVAENYAARPGGMGTCPHAAGTRRIVLFFLLCIRYIVYTAMTMPKL